MNWKQKLTSRKFWLAVVALVTAILTSLNMSEADVTNITTVIMAFGTVIAYIIGEGLIDAAATKNKNDKEDK
nr:MAG TPA: holin [Caudoviricetes sp.]